MASAAVATQNSFAALTFEAAAANTLMHGIEGAMRTATNPYRPEIPRGNKRERTKFDAFQLEQMENFFKLKPYPDGNDREEMAKNLNLTDVKVQIWFKNRRAKDRNQKHLDELMAKSRGDFATQKSLSSSSSNSAAGRSGELPVKKKRRTESPLPDPMLQQQHLQQQQQQQQHLQSSHNTKDIHVNGTGEIKQEIVTDTTNGIDYNNGIFDSSAWDEQKDIKSFYQPGNYAAFGFSDPTGTFQTPNTNWMTQPYPPYPFNFYQTPACYYPSTNGVTSQNAAVAYNDFYAATQYPLIANGLKDSTKVELPSTESPINNNNNISPTTIFKPSEIEQPYAKFT
uniref:Homeobox domain-containing protein n=1 Tax=Panagrolaimus sp. PS1159 TaxID=55785 RepID=A0AC35F9U9_9BILA